MTLYTTDAEYIAATEFARELSVIHNTFKDLVIPVITLIRQYRNNMSANNLASSICV